MSQTEAIHICLSQENPGVEKCPKQFPVAIAFVVTWNSGEISALGNFHRTCPENSRHMNLQLHIFPFDDRIWAWFTKAPQVLSHEVVRPGEIRSAQGPRYF